MNDTSKSYSELVEENSRLKQKVQELEIVAGERRKVERGLRDSENKYKTLTEKMSDIAWIADMNLKTLYVTPSIKTVLGFSQEKRIQQNVEEQLTPDSLSVVMDVMGRELALEEEGTTDPNRTLHLELEFFHQNGSTRWMDVIINGTRNEQGKLTGIHGVARDITDRKQAEESLKKAHEELERRVQERTEELAKAVHLLKEDELLLADESRRLHETNTALKVLLRQREEDQQDLERKVLANVRNLVLPYVEKLKSTLVDPAQTNYVDIISTNLQNIVSPFLRNLTATYMDFTPREIEVANLVREGKSAKEIALLLNCSLRSIEFHKDNIRRKLDLTHKKTNLRTHLLSLNTTLTP